MDGFKDSTKVKYMTGGPVKRAEAKMSKVMGEFASGKLHSGSKKGPEVTNKKQAVAIAMSEARKAGAKMPMKTGLGGGVFNERGKRATMAEIAAWLPVQSRVCPHAQPTPLAAARLMQNLA